MILNLLLRMCQNGVNKELTGVRRSADRRP